MITYKSIIERYCPHVSHNVSMEISRHSDGKITERCLHLKKCEQEQGGCQNRWQQPFLNNAH